MRVPDFFIIGAPKCGTTSLAKWLGDHPNVFMCQPKEPEYFSHDLGMRNRVCDESEYFSLFEKADDQHLAVGEASTGYLRSKVAVYEILRLIPEAKFIVCLRDPLEMVQSVHAQLVSMGVELEYNFEKAWRLQKTRMSGACLPKWESNPERFQYANICKVGEQVDKLLTQVERDKVLILFLEDIISSPRKEWNKVLDFLGLQDDGRNIFKAENVRREVRYPRIIQFMANVSELWGCLNLPRNTGLGRLLRVVATRPRRKMVPNSLDYTFIEELRREFAPDVYRLRNIIQKPYPSWVDEY